MATITLPAVITPAVLQAVAANMQRCYATLEQAEHDHAPAAAIDQLYTAFLQATSAYHTAYTRLTPDTPSLPVAQQSLFTPE